jgi:AAA domain
VASGQFWNGFRTTQGKVLIIQTDEPDVDFSDSLRDANYDRFERGLVQVETEWQFSQISQLTRWVEQEQPLLIIIDSFTAANCASELDEKDTNYGSCIYDLRNVANTYGCTFLILHHTNKLGESRGTTAIPDNVSEVWYLRHPKSEDNLPNDRRIWSIEKSRSRCSSKFAIGFDPDECVVAYHGEHQSTPNGQGNLEARLLEYFGRSASATKVVRSEPLSRSKNSPYSSAAAKPTSADWSNACGGKATF